MQNRFLGLRTCGYKVPDTNTAREWYTKVLGFPPYFDQPFYVGFEVAGYELGLQPEEAGSDSKRGTNVLVYWGVEDIEAEYQRLIELGGSEHEPVTEVGEGIKVASIFDPWGNVFGIIYNPHFKLK